MTLTLLPKGTGRRRAVDKVAELRDDLAKALSHLHAAGDEIAFLRNDVTDARARQAEAEEITVRQQADINDLTAENAQLREELAELKVRFGPQLAAEANANRITVPPMIRDTSDPADQATAPINVRPLWDALGLGPVTAPGRVA